MKIRKKGKNFPCGHSRKQFYVTTRKYFLKRTQEIKLHSYHVCRTCVQRISNRNNKKYVTRKTNKRWKTVRGKRTYFELEAT